MNDRRLLLTSLLSYAVARGFWTLKNWARVLTIGVSIFDLVIGGPHSKILGRIVSVIPIWYLLTPQVKAAFREVAPEWQQAV